MAAHPLAVASLPLFVCLACSSHPAFGGSDSGADVAPFGDGAVFQDGSVHAACGSWTIRSLGAGPDGVLGNADDVETSYVVLDFDAQGRVSRQTSYNGPGADAKWETPDDVVDSMQRLVLVSATEGDVWTASGPGADGVWGTGDDVVSARVGFQFDAQGRRVVEHDFDSAGPDGTWNTADDVLGRWYRVTYPNGELYAEEQLIDPGPDQIPDTSDDPVAILTTRFHDHGTFADGAGPDGTWGTSDDQLAGVYTYDFTTQGAITRATLYNMTGPDGAWSTADDVIGALVEFTCAGSANDELLMASGPDGILGTTDDTVQAHVVLVGCDSSVCSASQAPAVGAQPN